MTRPRLPDDGPSRPQLLIASLGVVPYAEALELQRTLARSRITGEIAQDLLLLVEHPPVVTLGRTAKARNLISSPELLRARGVELYEVERGGDVTFHGPGQLVGYPIIDLKRHKQDLHWYLRQIEAALIGALAWFGIPGERSEGYTGVWVPERAGVAPRKIASIGVHARDWVTWHGFALNVITDLDYFGLINPCGIDGVVMTSMARELGHAVAMPEAEEAVTRAFGSVFALEPTALDPGALPLPSGAT
ncbi:MAG: lipoyl(octanoyl) transferase LipB [Gemmatimonadota bacterium]|nr:lipoyl(octanoyl) transferase LipB [Gemmatimonadota bacterium]